MYHMITHVALPYPGTVQLTDRDLSYRLNTSQATTVIANYDIADKIDSVCRDFGYLCFEHRRVRDLSNH